jgi:hypothetical protein
MPSNKMITGDETITTLSRRSFLRDAAAARLGGLVIAQSTPVRQRRMLRHLHRLIEEGSEGRGSVKD